MRDEAAMKRIQRAPQDDGSCCYCFGDTTIRAKEMVCDGWIALEPISGDQVVCGSWDDLEQHEVNAYCELLEKKLNEKMVEEEKKC